LAASYVGGSTITPPGTEVHTHQEDAYATLLLDHAGGSARGARALIAETHIRLDSGARAAAAALDIAGGALLERISLDEPLARGPYRRKPVSSAAEAAARRLGFTALREPSTLNWRWRAPGLSQIKLPIAGASLVRLEAGAAAPAHDHTEDEWTLVLSGRFEDEDREYRVGELAFAHDGLRHRPRVTADQACICLAAFEGRWRFNNPVADLLSHVLM
jgi:putative transcriptional regulator